jgi:hypothetical protein
MSFFEDMFDGFHRRGQGRHHDDGHHGQDGHDDHDRDHHYGPTGGSYGGPPPARAASIPCPRCSAVVPLTPGTRFCASCGGPLAAEPVCQGCGSRLTPGAAFCHGCGNKV